MATGTVRWFSSERGYGFIAPADGTTDLFVHFTAIEGEGYKSLSMGQSVCYEIVTGLKGLQATAVRVVNDG